MANDPTPLEDTIGSGSDGATAAAAARQVVALPRGTVVGRYVVLSQLGAGGMGVVYAAYDPELDRKVALKLLHPSGAASGVDHARLLREAQTLAKLSHPGIVGVHDVGTVGERVWIAMEFVAGKTLRQWLGETENIWRDVLEVSIAAGRGLAAAHAAGIVHGDFKPDNVMVGDDGRVRVMDFGLASSEGHAPAVPLGGTPAYMAAEQLAGAAAEPRTDQFALCVTMWEALYRQRPFAGETLVELAANVIDARQRPWPRRASVPAWLRKIVQRGLSASVGERWATIEALLDACERGQARARLRRRLAVVGAPVLVALAVAGAYALDVRARDAECRAAGAGIAEVWDDDARARVRDALLATEVSYAQVTADKVMPWLDRHAEAWQIARVEACRDAQLRDVWDADTLDRSLWCLDDRELELQALVVELSRADAQVVQGAVSAAAGLAQVEPCRDRVALARLPAPPIERREEVRSVRSDLARAGALLRAGKPLAALPIASAARERAQTLGWPPLSAAAGVTEASVLEARGAYVEAERVGADAYYDAARAGAWDVALTAATQLVDVVGYRQARPVEGRAWSRNAELARAYAIDPFGLYEADLNHELAKVHYTAGDYAQARELGERALAVRETALGPDHPEVAVTLNNLAAVHFATSDYEHVRALNERALALWERAVGPNHPNYATSLNNLAALDHATGNYAQARALYQRALAIREKALGSDHHDVGTTLGNLGVVAQAMGAYEEARRFDERALAIREKALGPDHPDVATSLINLASVNDLMGDHVRARALYQRGLAVQEKVLGPEHPDFARYVANFAAVCLAQGDRAQARALLDRAIAIQRKTLGPDHIDLASSLTGLAAVHAASGEHDEALRVLESSTAIYDAREGPQDNENATRFALAKALVATGGDLNRARRQAEEARDGFRRAGKVEELAQVESWLASRGWR